LFSGGLSYLLARGLPALAAQADAQASGDYVEQLTFLLFLKMADEQSRPPFNMPSPIPKNVDWQRGTSSFNRAVNWGMIES
jgi:hypothetical protein